ncbi:transposase [Clostridia bacterium]|nr:transposase [Clostridia bacterium]
MGKLLYPFKHDIVFKMYFVRHQDQLKRLIALILKIRLDSITEFVVVNGEIPPEMISTKFCRLDIHMKVNGRLVDLEVQVNDEGDYGNRAAYYGARDYSSALSSGMEYRDIPPVIIISIIDFKLWRGDDVHSMWHVSNDATHQRMVDNWEWHFLELPKLSNIVDTEDELDIWLNIFNADTEEDIKKLLKLEVPMVETTINAYREVTADGAFLELVRMREDAKHNEISALARARREAHKEGKLEGRLERDREVALKMIANNFPDDIIEQLTGLTRATVHQ